LKFLTNGYASILSIALVGVAFGLWTRNSQSDPRVNLSPRPVVHSDLTESSDVLPAEPERSSIYYQLDSTQVSGQSVVGKRSKAIEMLPGIAHPLQMAEIAAAADGPLWKLNVSEGEAVSSDSVLALIDNRVAVASVISAQSSADRQAMLISANAKVSLAEQFLNRIQQAASKKAASGLEVDEASSRLAEAKAALQEGQESQRDAVSRLKIEQARLDTYEVRAPFSGTVIKIYPHLGETVSRGAPIIKIADIKRLRAELFVPLSLVSAQRIGETIELRADLPNRPLLSAKIVFIAPLIDAATQTIRIVVEIDNTTNQLPAGFAVRLSQTGTDSDYH
jgi:RND family efflux transporter MFP subunit